jgi:hypothetical protein
VIRVEAVCCVFLVENIQVMVTFQLKGLSESRMEIMSAKPANSRIKIHAIITTEIIHEDFFGLSGIHSFNTWTDPRFSLNMRFH